MADHTELHDRILDQALALAEAGSWETLRLHDVAEALQISLDDIRRCYPQKDDLVEAWFDRADQAILSGTAVTEFSQLPESERIERVLMMWLDTLAPHRRLTRQMLMYKLEPGHVHLQILGLMRISRTVQWFREAARLDADGWRRIADEIWLTRVYLATFTRWLFDDSPDSRSSRTCLAGLLRCREQCGNLATRLWCVPGTTRHDSRYRPEH